MGEAQICSAVLPQASWREGDGDQRRHWNYRPLLEHLKEAPWATDENCGKRQHGSSRTLSTMGILAQRPGPVGSHGCNLKVCVVRHSHSSQDVASWGWFRSLAVLRATPTKGSLTGLCCVHLYSVGYPMRNKRIACIVVCLVVTSWRRGVSGEVVGIYIYIYIYIYI